MPFESDCIIESTDSHSWQGDVHAADSFDDDDEDTHPDGLLTKSFLVGALMWTLEKSMTYLSPDVADNTVHVALIMMTTYWAVGFLYAVIDLTQKPTYFYATRIQADKSPPKLSEYILLSSYVFKSQILVVLPTILFFCSTIMPWRRMMFPSVLNYDVGTLLLSLAVYSLFAEVGFYSTHLLFHHPSIYQYIHKKHHSFTAPVAVAALYAHPAEILLSNLIPLVLGPIVLGSHPYVYWTWFVVSIINTLNAHCGYELPFMPSPRFHDLHHRKFRHNYGILYMMDAAFGTLAADEKRNS